MKTLSFLLLLSLSLLPVGVWGQGIQRVHVVEYMESEAKRPLAGVEVAVVNAGSQLSNDEGDLSLSFRSLHNGDKVSVRRVDKSGYEIFNKEAVDQWNMSTQTPFRIVMCSSEKFRAICDNYMAKASSNYERQLQQEQERLQRLYQEKNLAEEEYQVQMAQLEEDYNTQLDNLDNYVDRFARIDLESLSDEQRHIVSLVQEGRFEEAIAEQEKADYLSKFAQANTEAKKAEEASQQLAKVAQEKQQDALQLKQAIQTQINTYELAGGRENFEKSYQLRKALVDADTTDIDQMMDYLTYLQHQYKVDEVREYSEIILRNTMDQPIKQMRCLTILGISLTYLHLKEEPIETLERAERIGREMLQTDSSYSARREYVHCVNFLLEHYAMAERVEDVDALLPKALALDAILQKEDPDGMENTYTHISLMLSQIDCLQLHQQYKEAVVVVNECLDLLRPRREEHPAFKDQYDVALNRGLIASAMGEDFEAAIRFGNEIYEIAKQAYAHNPEGQFVHILEVLGNQASIYIMMEEYPQALKYLDEMLDIVVQVEQIEGHGIPEERYFVNYHKAEVYGYMGDLPHAKEFARKALDNINQFDEETRAQCDSEWLKEVLNK